MTEEQLLSITMQCPKKWSRWRHYKGGLYIVVSKVIQESTLIPLVAYRAIGVSVIFARPLAEWEEAVTDTEGIMCPRFRPFDGR